MNKVDKINNLSQRVLSLLGAKVIESKVDRDELTIIINETDNHEVLQLLRDDANTAFEQCVDLCGVDYLDYHNDYRGVRFAVVYHLLSLKYNWRLRVRAFIPNTELPIIRSVIDIYSSANWLEREAFDLFGIVFEGHPDLRRLLTDYGFIGHPFRKDFPISGYVEMIYDEEQKRVVYQPVSIEPREITPRIIREETYCVRN